MTTSPYTGAAPLARVADGIAKNAPHPLANINPLIVLTDPKRLPDPLHLAQHLPKGCTLIYRHFGDPAARQISARASAICQTRGLIFLVTCDSGVQTDKETGVHFPETLHDAIPAWRRAMPTRVFTAAAHTQNAAQRALARGADAVLLSPVFDTVCAGSGTTIGAEKFARICKSVQGPVYALGGITTENAKYLNGYASGLAVVSGVTGSGPSEMGARHASTSH